MTETRLFQGLNPPQCEAVRTTEGPLLVIAGAGSGKTRVITHRIAYLIEEKGVSPHNIFAATFTNKAAREMKDRVARLCITTEMSTLAIATFHSQCATIMRQEAESMGLTPKFTICDATDQRALMRDILRDFNHDPKQLKPQDVLGVVSLAKMKLLDGKEAE
ncbi:MAG: UvrD-helicase domain-containing protein, partial [Candidatus Sumerlaeota bacterium]